MDNYFASFPTTTTTASTFTITTSIATMANVNINAQQMGYPQNLHFQNLSPFYSQTPSFPSQITQGYPTSLQYFQPYNQTVQIPCGNTFQQMHQQVVHPTYSAHSVDQNSALCPMPNWQPYKMTSFQKIREEKKKQQKIAREIRIQARQRLRISYADSASCSYSKPKTPNTTESDYVEDKANLYNFQLSNGKRVRQLFKKKLQSSDVNSYGRIIISKKVAEQNLPTLRNKQGIQFLCKDVNSDKEWKLKFKYWSNNKTRMYVLENTGSLVKHYQLQSGDYITVYQDELKNMYVSTSRREEKEQVAEPLTNSGEDTYSYMLAPYKNKANDEEEEESLALLIEELKQKDTEGLNSFNF